MSTESSTAASTVQMVKLEDRQQVAEGTMAFYFDKPAGFEFRAGQAMDVTVLDPPETDAEGNIRTFSIISAPFEERLGVATRMRDTAFKRVLKTVPLGTEVKVENPGGSLTLHKNASKPGVFLAGGIGITPFMSILGQAAHEKLPHRLYLFYANHRPEDAPFLDALGELQKANPNFRFVPTMTDMEKSKQEWTGERGKIDGAMLSRALTDLHGPIYYIAGPPAMVAAMRKMLIEATVDEDDIRTEEFAGY